MRTFLNSLLVLETLGLLCLALDVRELRSKLKHALHALAQEKDKCSQLERKFLSMVPAQPRNSRGIYIRARKG